MTRMDVMRVVSDVAGYQLEFAKLNFSNSSLQQHVVMRNGPCIFQGSYINAALLSWPISLFIYLHIFTY